MKKNLKPSSRKISPAEAIQFLDDVRKLSSQVDEPTVPISIRLPNNILRSLRLKAKAENKKYQSLIVECLRKCLQEKS
jgi:hypothetical protein